MSSVYNYIQQNQCKSKIHNFIKEDSEKKNHPKRLRIFTYVK